jgi:putative heme-binding domain-containing protein
VNAVAGLQYEPRRLRVPPGRRIGLTFRNADPSMPHNLVVVELQRLQSIGNAAMLLAADPRAIATHYVPDDPGVICLAPILNPDDQYTVYFDSPTEKGAYPFVCTFPGHWKVMQGILYVADPADELPEEPQLTSGRSFIKMWKLSDLAEDADRTRTVSFERGREMFSEAGCIQCHVIAGKGTNLGPDLTTVNKRFRGAKLLQQILEPSAEINKQYQTYLATKSDGTMLTGLMVKDEPQAIHLLPNPLHPEELIVVPKDQIDELMPSSLSTMPKGLLMTLTREEILDLLHYVERGGVHR